MRHRPTRRYAEMMTVDGQGQASLDDHGLARVVQVDPRTVWKNEPADFTPWIESNLGLLSQELGIEGIVSAQREVPVGGFSLDILGEDTQGRRIAIENQLDASHHNHLGQLLVYGAGLKASIVVWLASRIREEHREVLTWLNEHTDADIGFFGVEVGVIRIGQSPPAPVFNVAVQPNEWGKVTRQRTQTAHIDEQRQAFYEVALERIAERIPGFRIPKAPAQNWVSFSAGPFGHYAITFAWPERFRLEAYLDSGIAEVNKALFDELFEDREAIEARVGESLDWERLDDRRASRIAVYRDSAPDLSDPAEVESAATWAAERAASLLTALDGRLRQRAAALKGEFREGPSTHQSVGS